jgi:hypothetical protein
MTTKHDRALRALSTAGFDYGAASSALDALERSGLRLADATAGELVCRWVDVRERAVPPEADTIIRTVTRSSEATSRSSTHWLEGIEPPPFTA